MTRFSHLIALVVAVMCVSLTGWSFAESTAAASTNSLGLNYVDDADVTLRGVRSDLDPPAQYNILSGNFGLESVRMQDPAAFMQMGIIQFNGTSIDPQMCTGPAGQLKLLWEYVVTPGSFMCGEAGNTDGSRQTLKVQRTTSGSGWWAAFANGSFYVNQPLTIGKSQDIQIGGELGDGTHTNSNTTVCADYGSGSSATPWQRTADVYDGTDDSTWTTVHERDGIVRAGPNSGNWQIDAPPTPLEVYWTSNSC